MNFSGDPDQPARAGDPQPPDGAGPSFIGRFRIESCIGKGGMGEVYSAYDPTLDRRVALKRLRSDVPVHGDAVSILLHEARAASSLRHRAIVSVHDILELDGGIWVVEELAEGLPLRERIGRPWPLRDFYRFAEECAAVGVVIETEGKNVWLTAATFDQRIDLGAIDLLDGGRSDYRYAELRAPGIDPVLRALTRAVSER